MQPSGFIAIYVKVFKIREYVGSNGSLHGYGILVKLQRQLGYILSLYAMHDNSNLIAMISLLCDTAS